MKVSYPEWHAQLKSALRPVYCVLGDEPLQHQEACDALRQVAKTQGYTERVTYTAQTGFDWSSLLAHNSHRSLFAEQQLIECHLPTGKPGKIGSQALRTFIEQQSNTTLLLLRCPKLDRASQQASWMKAIDAAGVILTLWPIERAQLPRWIKTRSQAHGLTLSDTACQKLAQCAEGNLLAIAQTLEKLSLLHGKTTLSDAQVEDSLAEYARYTLYQLPDCALLGDAAQYSHMLAQLRLEGIALPLVLWGWSQSLQQILKVQQHIAQGDSFASCCKRLRIWPKQQPPLQAAVKRYPMPLWQRLLNYCYFIDRMVKGLSPGDPWLELRHLGLCAAGKVPITAKATLSVLHASPS